MDVGKFLSDLWANGYHLFAWLYEGVLRYNLQQWGWPAWLVDLVSNLVGVVSVSTFGLLLVLFTIWLERKVAARLQDRIGPNRVGPYGLLQSVADVIKLLTKENITPAGADRFLYNVAPLLSVMAVLLLWAVIPFGPDVVGTNVDIGVIYLVAAGSLGTLAILMAGWSSNNKYALLGAFRTVAQLVSYEVPMILALIVPVLLARSMAVNTIVQQQVVWYVVLSPIGALIFFVSSLAEVGRTPFDLLEAESEIVAGFHIEYTGMKFGMFFLAEFLHAFIISVLTATLFFGGWRGPWVNEIPMLGILYLMLKTFAVYFVVMWIRSTLPRIRIDHMLSFNWKFLVPVSLANLVVIAVLDKVMLVPTSQNLVDHLPRAALLFTSNLALGAVIMALVHAFAERARRGAEPIVVEDDRLPAAEHAVVEAHYKEPNPPMQIDALQIVFLVGALITIGASVMVVANRNLFHCAVWLIVALFGVAILFVLLDAGFLAAAQVVVYIGAIATLIIFAVMLTRRVMQPAPEAANAEWPLALGGSLLLFALLAVPFVSLGLLFKVAEWNVPQAPAADMTASLATLGRVLVDAGAVGGAYAVPFELASLLLLGALVGSIVIARDQR